VTVTGDGWTTHQTITELRLLDSDTMSHTLRLGKRIVGSLCHGSSRLQPSVLSGRSSLQTSFASALCTSFRRWQSSTQPSFTSPQIVRAEDGRQFAAFDKKRNPKLKPSIVSRRLNKMKTYEGAEKNIRVSPWRLNLVCQFAAGLPLQEALTQLEFNKKSNAPVVQKFLRRTANLADIRDGLQPSQLEVAECFATKGRPLKRVMMMGRGRMGRMEHKHAHMRVVLREIDFKLRIYQAPTINQKKKWFMLQQQAEKEGARAMAERQEIKRLEKESRAAAAKK
jgi:large subunit ribosomal protein L22